MTQQIGCLLGRWHQWRRAYSHERGYARVHMAHISDGDSDEDELETMLMRAIEEEIQRQPQELQLAFQHVARAECLGEEVVCVNRLPTNAAARDSLCERAPRELSRRLLAEGLL